MQYSGKMAVITGGASGIGAAICRALVARGAQVVIVDWDHEKASELSAELGDMAHSERCDVSDAAAVEALAEKVWSDLGGTDLVFANAGIGLGAPILRSTLEEFEATIGVNLRRLGDRQGICDPHGGGGVRRPYLFDGLGAFAGAAACWKWDIYRLQTRGARFWGRFARRA